MRFLDKIARFWQECTTFEKIYCVAFTVTSIAISIIQDASFISALASITGMWCVFLVAKGNLNNFYFGAVFLQFLTLFNVHYSQWDSVTLIISIVGQILTTFRFVEQWVTWLCLDIFNVIWWFLVLYPQNGDLTMAVMWAFKLINVFYGWYTWKKLGKAQTKLVSGPYCPYEPQFTRHY